MGLEQESSYRELTHTPDGWNMLWKNNTLISPDTLGKTFPMYEQFQPTEDPNIWSKTGTITPLETPVIVGFYGPTSAGKDMLIDGITIPHRRIVTTTTRTQRPDQKDGVVYHFITDQTFRERVNQDVFLENMEESGGLYGTTRQEVEEKIQKAQTENIPLLIWRGNVQGHQKFAPKVLAEYKKTVPGIFLLPRLTVQEYFQHIQKIRGEIEAQKRWSTAQAEIEHAPEIVDYILLNLFDETDGKQTSIESCNTLLSRLCTCSIGGNETVFSGS